LAVDKEHVMSETGIAPPPDEPSADSFFSRLIGVFISPGRTFESIVRRPDFWAPLIVMTVAGYAVVEAMLAKIGAGRIVRQAIEQSSRASSLTPEQIDQAVQRAAGITAIGMRLVGIVGVPIVLLAIAAIGLFFVNVLFGAATNFEACFSVICYANLVGLVGMVLAVVMVLFGDPEQFNTNNPVPTTVGFFLDPRETSKPLYAIASSFDIFRVWFIALASLGLSAASAKKVRTLTIFLSYLGLWILITLGKAGWAALAG
jgi:Yip1 domain